MSPIDRAPSRLSRRSFIVSCASAGIASLLASCTRDPRVQGPYYTDGAQRSPRSGAGLFALT